MDKFPLGTFSPQNFVEHLTKFTGAGLPVFDLNILTMNESSFASQVDQLKPYCVDNRCLVELGNEIYLNPYRWRFLTADSYMEACEPLVTLLRKEFPNVVISVAAGGIGSFLPSSYLSWLNEDSRKIVEDRKGEFRLRLRLNYLGRIAEKIKYITYLGCAPARKEESRTKNWKFQEE